MELNEVTPGATCSLVPRHRPFGIIHMCKQANAWQQMLDHVRTMTIWLYQFFFSHHSPLHWPTKPTSLEKRRKNSKMYTQNPTKPTQSSRLKSLIPRFYNKAAFVWQMLTVCKLKSIYKVYCENHIGTDWNINSVISYQYIFLFILPLVFDTTSIKLASPRFAKTESLAG